MGRRRYRSDEPDAVSEFFELLVQIAGASPLIGCILGGVFLVGAAVLWRQVILIKVRLGDLLYIPPGSGYEWLNKANQKHVDFVLCNSADLRAQLVIELDDKTHDQPGRIERDRFVDEALACAQIPILHVRAAVAYDVQELNGQIARALSGSSV